MDELLYALLALVIVLIIFVIVGFVLILKTKKQSGEFKVEVDDEETLRQIKFMQESIARLKLELEGAFKERFGEQTEKLTENDQKFMDRVQKEIDGKLEKLLESVQKKMTDDANITKKTYGELGEKIQSITAMKEELDTFTADVKKLTTAISGDNQKRGKFGEFLLENILDHVFEGTYGLYDKQKGIKGVIPDAIIYLPREKNNKLCIDAKFPYANFLNMFTDEGEVIEEAKKQFLNDVKKKIEEVKSKYIIPGETIEYALCFFPSDEIFNYLHAEAPQIIEQARKSNVVLVSPATLQPTLSTLRTLMIDYRKSQKLAEINADLIKLSSDFGILERKWNDLSNRITALVNSRDDFYKTYNRLHNWFQKISIAEEIEENNEN